MTMNLLKQIASSRLPVTFYREADIDGVRLLRAAGLVVALVPSPSDPIALSGSPTAAQVLALTPKGREELARFDHPRSRPVHARIPKVRTAAWAEPVRQRGFPSRGFVEKGSRSLDRWRG